MSSGNDNYEGGDGDVDYDDFAIQSPKYDTQYQDPQTARPSTKPDGYALSFNEKE